jgi:hypothetical protein
MIREGFYPSREEKRYRYVPATVVDRATGDRRAVKMGAPLVGEKESSYQS